MATSPKNNLALVLSEGEGQRIEFKEKPARLDREMVAFANASGGSIFLGVDDRGEIAGISITNDLKSKIHDVARNCDPPVTVSLRRHRGEVLEIRVVEGTSKPHQCREGFFLRNGPNAQKLTRDEIVQVVLTTGTRHFDEEINERFRFPKDLDRQKLNNFLALAEIRHRASAESILMGLDVAEHRKGRLCIRQAGALFFGKDPQRLVRESHITCVRYRGTDRFEVIDRAEVLGDPISMIEESLKFTQRNMAAKHIINGNAQHRNLYEYPPVAVREAIVNAVMHRDYYYDASHTYIHMFSDRLEVENPGGLLPGLRFEELGTRSVRRNRTIADLLFRAKYVERIGSGIQRMQRALEENGNPPMQLSATSFFVVRFFPRVESLEAIQLTPRQTQLCQLFAARGTLTKSDAVTELGISGDTALREISKLMQAGVVEKLGVSRNTRYAWIKGRE